MTNNTATFKLPKLYRPVQITFWSLRNGVGDGLGVIFDIDTRVTRLAMRVLCDDGWKWQIKDTAKHRWWDWCIDTDQECLNEYGMDKDDLEITLSSRQPAT